MISSSERGMTMISVSGRVNGWPRGGDRGRDSGGCADPRGDGGGVGEGWRGSPRGGGDPKWCAQTGGTDVSWPVEHERPETVLEGMACDGGPCSTDDGAVPP